MEASNDEPSCTSTVNVLSAATLAKTLSPWLVDTGMNATSFVTMSVLVEKLNVRGCAYDPVLT